MSIYARICPLCEKGMDEEICPIHNVPTIEIASLEDQGDALNPGDVIEERYRIKSLLGRGAMGAVYRAVQLSMDRDVAVKTLLKRLLSDYKLVQRFYREARAASRLDHPNIIQTYDFGIDRQTKIPFIAMEFLDGQELAEMVKAEGALSEEVACGILEQVSKALAEAHSKGVIHRDLKPENIRVRTLADDELQAKVLDFGIAKVLEGDESGDDKLTGTGMTLGTPPYMSPEQIVGEPVDARADLYSVGCILHELLTGKLPFSSTERRQVFLMHMNASTPELPAVLADGNPPSAGLIEFHKTLLQKDKELRPASAKVTAKIFRALSRGKTINISTTLTEALAEVRAHTLQVRDDVGGQVLDAAALLQMSEEGTDIAIPTDPDQYVTTSLAEVKSISITPASDIGANEEPASAPAQAPEPIETVPEPSTPSPKRNWIPLIAGLVLIGGGVAAAVLGGGDDPGVSSSEKTTNTEVAPTVAPSSKSESPSKQSQPKTALKAEPKTAGQPSATKTGKPAVQKESQPKGLARIRVESDPTGAEVFEGVTPLGTTPMDVLFSAGASERLIQIRKDGFFRAETLVSTSMKQPLKVTLKPIPKPSKASKPSKEPKKRAVKRPVKKRPVPQKPVVKKKPKSFKTEVW